jgi:hypothetical protein
VSLILEALKKLERERDTSGRGFLVVAQTPWRGSARRRWLRLGAVAVAGGALAGAGAWLAWRVLSSGAGSAPPAATTPLASARPAPAPGATLPPPIWDTAAPARPAVARAAAAPRDERGPKAEPPAVLRLEAISVQDGEPVAVINGRLVRKGESVDGALVTWIGADAVEVEVDGRRRTLGF